jgi:thiosulfate/3-mercaptopyruvate sulfurtransferase
MKALPLGLRVAAIALAIGACDAASDPSPSDVGTGAPIATLPPAVVPADLTNRSADDYAHNRWGLIDATTLEAYAKNWRTGDTAAADAAPNGRPAHLGADARLVVLQLNAANRAPGENYVPSSTADKVHVYEIDAFRFNETRDTGLVSNSVRYQASGPTTDAWLARYGIDLRRDFVVFAAGANGATNGAFFQELARAVYWLSYWGADLKNLAIVNGTLAKNYTGTLSGAKLAEGAVSNDGFTVKSLRRDHTALTLPLEDFLAVVDGGLQAKGVVTGFDRQFIIDARPSSQFNRTAANAAFVETHPGQFITTGWNSTGAPSADDAGRAKTYVPVEGHVKGARTFPWANLLVDTGDNNWKYKSRTELEDTFTSAGYAPADKATKVVVSQCRTNFEVQVNGFASRVILGYPTVHFDGSLVEYTSLVSNHPTAEFNLRPEDPAYKFRTDVPARLSHYKAGANAEAPTTDADDAGVPAYNVPTGTGAADRKVAQAVINRNATTTRKALDEDREFKRVVETP